MQEPANDKNSTEDGNNTDFMVVDSSANDDDGDDNDDYVDAELQDFLNTDPLEYDTGIQVRFGTFNFATSFRHIILHHFCHRDLYPHESSIKR